MENLHAPTIQSGPTTGIGPDGLKTKGLTLAELQVKKDGMEAELRALSAVLTSVHSLVQKLFVNMLTSLYAAQRRYEYTIDDTRRIPKSRHRCSSEFVLFGKNHEKSFLTILSSNHTIANHISEE